MAAPLFPSASAPWHQHCQALSTLLLDSVLRHMGLHRVYQRLKPRTPVFPLSCLPGAFVLLCLGLLQREGGWSIHLVEQDPEQVFESLKIKKLEKVILGLPVCAVSKPLWKCVISVC